MAAPIPLDAPVTRATFPVRSRLSFAMRSLLRGGGDSMLSRRQCRRKREGAGPERPEAATASSIPLSLAARIGERDRVGEVPNCLEFGNVGQVALDAQRMFGIEGQTDLGVIRRGGG